MTSPGVMLLNAPAYFTVSVPASLSILGEWTRELEVMTWEKIKMKKRRDHLVILKLSWKLSF